MVRRRKRAEKAGAAKLDGDASDGASDANTGVAKTDTGGGDVVKAKAGGDTKKISNVYKKKARNEKKKADTQAKAAAAISKGAAAVAAQKTVTQRTTPAHEVARNSFSQQKFTAAAQAQRGAPGLERPNTPYRWNHPQYGFNPHCAPNSVNMPASMWGPAAMGPSQYSAGFHGVPPGKLVRGRHQPTWSAENGWESSGCFSPFAASSSSPPGWNASSNWSAAPSLAHSATRFYPNKGTSEITSGRKGEDINPFEPHSWSSAPEMVDPRGSSLQNFWQKGSAEHAFPAAHPQESSPSNAGWLEQLAAIAAAAQSSSPET